MKDHTRMVEEVTFSPDGPLLATASRNKTARLWDPQHAGQIVRRLAAMLIREPASGSPSIRYRPAKPGR